jgi:hypothetical protein
MSKTHMPVSQSEFVQSVRLAERYDMAAPVIHKLIRDGMQSFHFTYDESLILLNVTNRSGLENSLQLQLLKDLLLPSLSSESGHNEGKENEVIGKTDDADDTIS